MLNTFEAMGNVFSKQGQKAVRWFSTFQERAQRYYGITKAQTQSVIRSMVESGYTVDEMMSRTSDRMSGVHSNVTTLSMGLDAYFERASGHSMAGMTELVVEYGDSLKVAANKYTDLMFAAQSSGMGVSKFIDSVRSGSQALTQYGIDVKDVASSLLNVKKHYEDLGMTSQAAGGWAGKGLQSIAQGMANASDINVMVMMRRHPEMGYYEAKQSLQEGWMEKNKSKRYGEQIQGIIEFLEEKVGPDEAKQKEFLSQQPGWSYLGASTLMSLKDNINNQGELIGATKEQMKELDKSFKTQGKTMSELQKTQHKLIDAIAKIGQGLLQVVTGIFGTIVTGFASIPMLIKALTLSGAEREQALSKIVDINNKQLGNVVSGFEKATAGAGMFAKVLGDSYKDIFPNFEGLQKLQSEIDKSSGSRTLAESGVEALAGAAGVEQPRMFAEEFDKSAKKFFDPLTKKIDWALDKERKNDYERLRDLMGEAKYIGDIDKLKQYMPEIPRTPSDQEIQVKPKPSQPLSPPPMPRMAPLEVPKPKPMKQISIPTPVPRGAPTTSRPKQMKTPAPVFKGPDSISSPKTTLPASVLHNSVTGLQSKLASEVSR
jgi:hypothetical protein